MYGVPPTAIWLWKSGTTPYRDLTYSLARRGDYLQPTGATFSMSSAADELYIGYENRYDAIICWLRKVGLQAAGSGIVWAIGVEQSSYSGAAATALLLGDAVETIEVARGGINYSAAPPVTLVGGGGSGAMFMAMVAADVGGPVDSILRVTGGSGYTSAPEVRIPAWEQAIPVQEDPYKFEQEMGYVQFDLRDPRLQNWEALPLSSLVANRPSGGPIPDEVPRYWMRATLMGTMDTSAELEAIAVRPYVSVATPKDVQSQLQWPNEFTADTNPSYNTVEDFLRGAEDSIARVTGHSYRPEFIEDEQLNFRAYGMALRFRPILEMLKLEVWDGDSYEIREVGRDQRWHYEAETGMVYVSSLYLGSIPASMRRGYSFRQDQGAFKRGVRVSYIYGHDPRTDPFASEVGRIVTKQACLDIAIDRDFAMLLPQNLDRVTLERKIQTWREEVNEYKDTYRRLSMT